MKDLTVLVTGCGSPGAYGIVKSLRMNRERRIRILGVDVDPLVANRYFVDEFLIPPKRSTPEFMEYVLDLSRQRDIDLVFPVPTAELEMFAAASPRFESQGQRVVVSSAESLAVANNKAKLYERVTQMGLSCAPVYRLASSWDNLVSAAHELGYPGQRICIKLHVSTGARGFRILDLHADRMDLLLNAFPTSAITSLEELAPFLQSASPFPELVVMEYLPGKEYDVDVLASKGRSLSIIPRCNERMWYGLSLVSKADGDVKLIELSRQIVANVGLSYVVSLSFRRDSKDQPKLIEINPRVPGSVMAATMAGVNMPYLAVKLALGENVEIPQVRWGTQMVRYWEEMFLSPDSGLMTRI